MRAVYYMCQTICTLQQLPGFHSPGHSGAFHPPDKTSHPPHDAHNHIWVADVLPEEADRCLPAHLGKFSCSGDISHPFPRRLSVLQRAWVSFRFTHPAGHPIHLLRDTFPIPQLPSGYFRWISSHSVWTAHPSQYRSAALKEPVFTYTGRTMNWGPP